MKYKLFIVLFLASLSGFAQNPYDSIWHFMPFDKKINAGIDYAKGEELSKNKNPQPIVVAVIDNGVDVDHPDLQGRIWVNEGEIPGNGIDDDENGYIDDIHGWNFIGSADTSVTYDNMELTRQYVLLKEKYKLVSPSAVQDKTEYERYLRIKDDFQSEYNHAKQNFEFYRQLMLGLDRMQSKYGQKMVEKDLDSYTPRSRDEYLNILLIRLQFHLQDTVDLEDIKEGYEESASHYDYQLHYAYNTKFDPREELVGDNYDDINERLYGNNKIYINEEFSSHGTHVAGIIAANSENEIGAKGICQQAKIMVIRCVPEGDERDKDVANSIMYAVDNGAKIINMSFGKGYAHNSEAVRTAVKYASEKGVLLIHAAGNDAKNNDFTDNFPNDFGGDFQDIWIEVGASSWHKKPNMLANFSNYGKKEVDLFAPGVDIYSTMPDSAYEALDGTSMASPVVSGVAAFVWSCYPEFSAQEIRSILIDSAIPVKKRQQIPGSKKKKKPAKLSASGAIINLGAAMQLAEERMLLKQ